MILYVISKRFTCNCLWSWKFKAVLPEPLWTCESLWVGGVVYKTCSPRVYLPQILINLSEIGTENLHFNKLTRDSGAAGLWIILREKLVQSFFILSVLLQKKKKALRAVFRHLSRHLTFENDSQTFHRGLPSQEAKQQLLPQHWCLQKNAENFFRADAPCSIHPF